MKADEAIRNFWIEYGNNNPTTKLMAFVVANGNSKDSDNLVRKAKTMKIPVYQEGGYNCFKGCDLAQLLTRKKRTA